MRKLTQRCAIAVAILLVLSGCSSLLPVTHSNASPFKTFDEARDAVVALVPMKSSLQAANQQGVDFSNHPNTKFLTHSDIVRMLVPAGMIKREDLDSGILVCVEARDACRGLEVTASRVSKTRVGNFFADFSSYKQRTVTSGWRFNALILHVNDLVVYRSWGGQPRLDEEHEANRPLGPFQDMGPSLLSSAR